MSSTLLQLIQQTTGELGLTVPNFVVGNSSTDTVQQLALLNALGNELQRGYEWQALDKEYRLTTQYLVATGDLTVNSAVITNLSSTTGLDSTYMVTGVGVSQDTYVFTVDSPTQVTLSQPVSTRGTAVSLTFGKTKYSLPSDYDRQINRTHFDKSKRWEMLGPESAQQWQWLKSSYISTGPRIRYRLLGGYFQIWPILSTPEYLGFEYMSNGWVESATGTPKSSFTVDTDTCIFPDRLMVLGLKMKYFEIKGFDASAFTRDFQDQLSIAKANDAGAATLSFSPRMSSVLIGFENIPDSNYGS